MVFHYRNFAEEYAIACLGCLLCQRVYPATDTLHGGIGVPGVEHHRPGLGAAELFEQRGLSFDHGKQTS